MKFFSLLIINFFVAFALCFPNGLRANPSSNSENNNNHNRVLLPGGWSEIVDPNSNPRIVEEAKWACEKLFPNQLISVNVISAAQQVVAGMNYRMVVNFLIKENETSEVCKVYDIRVYDRFGDKTLQSADKLDITC